MQLHRGTSMSMGTGEAVKAIVLTGATKALVEVAGTYLLGNAPL